jgi:hypothetical protein
LAWHLHCYFSYGFQLTIEYFRLNIEYLRNSFHFKKDGATRSAHAAQALALRERLRCASDIHKYSICNLQSSIPAGPG